MALLCDDVMATGEDAFSNGANGGNQTTEMSFSLNAGAGCIDLGDEGDNGEEDEDIDGESGPFGDIPVRHYFSFFLPFHSSLFIPEFFYEYCLHACIEASQDRLNRVEHEGWLQTLSQWPHFRRGCAGRSCQFGRHFGNNLSGRSIEVDLGFSCSSGPSLDADDG
jgi:hypothetical protein